MARITGANNRRRHSSESFVSYLQINNVTSATPLLPEGGRRPFSLTQFVKAGWAGRKCCSKAFSLAQSGKNAFAPRSRIRNPEVALLAPAERIILWRPSLRHACNFQPSNWALQRVRQKNCGDDILMRNRERFEDEKKYKYVFFWKFSRSFCRAIVMKFLYIYFYRYFIIIILTNLEY